MDDCSCIYQASLEGLHKMNYYNEVEGFIKYALSNSKNISRVGIRCIEKM